MIGEGRIIGRRRRNVRKKRFVVNKCRVEKVEAKWNEKSEVVSTRDYIYILLVDENARALL